MEQRLPSIHEYFGRVRKLDLARTMPRASRHRARPAQVEVEVNRPDAPRESAIVAEEEAGRTLAILASRDRDLPRLDIDGEHGAVDVRLENAVGKAVKRGLLLVDGPGGPVTVEIDPATRRFRRGSLSPGDYTIHAQAGADGSGSATLRVRANEVTRHAVVLDGRQIEGTTSLRLAVGNRESVRVKVFNRDTGAAVLDGSFTVRDGFVDLLPVPIGSIHLDVEGDGGATSCYDADTGDERFRLPPKFIEIKRPPWRDLPDPPDWFQELGGEFKGGWEVFHQLGIGSLEQLAHVEPEALMHDALDQGLSVHSRVLALAVDTARALIGAATPDALVRIPLRVAAGGSTITSLNLQQEGKVALDVDLRGERGTVVLGWPGHEESFDVDGSRRLTIDVTKALVTQRAQLRIRVENTADHPIAGSVAAVLPQAHEITPRKMTTRDHLNSIYSSLAERNPGILAHFNEVTLLPGNIAGWVSHARAAMHTLGVCSIDDLGPMRMDPAQKLQAGAYVAPAHQPPIAVPLTDYTFSHVIDGSILRYLPNETLHDTAIVLASEWNIRGQHIVLASDVRELLVVVHSIGYDGGSSITWEHTTLPDGPAYWPSPAPDGAQGCGPGANGHPGTDGNQNPGINTGANAVVDAPIITMYLRNATNGLPPIDLRGQQGGAGGRGQDGGRGGDGQCGEKAEGSYWSGCCRGVGWGGDGGKGGKGGRGGRGGDGGRGGRITVLTPPASITAIDAQHPAIDINPGAGGVGGPPGNPGAGGKGGPAGSSECEPYCSGHPERHGNDGASGDAGIWGPAGAAGAAPPSDALQFLPLTEAQWDDQFNTPHILHVQPLEVEPGEHVTISGDHFDPGSDHVFFDGVDVGAVASATSAAFDVPLTIEGGFHPVVVGTGPTKSNKVMIKVIPKVTALTPGRWIEGQGVTIDGLAFRTGCRVIAEDWHTTPHTPFLLPVDTVSRTQIHLTIPAAPLGNLRGVRRIRVWNPDDGLSRDERVARISDTIVVRVAAFRLVGTTTGTQTVHTAAEITDLFSEGTAHSISIPWSGARISFQLAQPVTDLMVDDTVANVFPFESGSPHATWDRVLTAATFVPGALNILFARDVEDRTAYAQFGGGPVVFGDDPGQTITPTELQWIVAHEFGHAMCLRHVCDGSGEGPGTFFNRNCQQGDEAFLMYPFWGLDGFSLNAGECDTARHGASYVETGKTAPLAIADLFQSTVPARCAIDDTDN